MLSSSASLKFSEQIKLKIGDYHTQTGKGAVAKIPMHIYKSSI